MHKIYELFSFLQQNTISCSYLDYILLALIITNTILKFLGYEFSHFYYVSFFGLFPYRVVKAILDEKIISFSTLIELFGGFCLIWRYIDFVIPFVFSTYLGQCFLSLSLIFMEKFLFVDDILRKNPKFRIFLYICFFLTLFIYWLSIGAPSFFILTVAQTFAWFTNFARHFLEGEHTKQYVDEFLGNALPRNSSNFEWGHIVQLMSYVSKCKHNRSISNKLGLRLNNLKYSTIAKRYFPVDDPITVISLTTKNSVLLSMLTFNGFMLFIMTTKLRINKIIQLAEKKKKDDDVHEKNITSYQEEIENTLNKANSYSHNYMRIEQLLEKKGVTNITFAAYPKISKNSVVSDQSIFSPFSFETSITNLNKNLEITKLFMDLNLYRVQYLNTIDYLKNLILKQVSLKKIVDSDVSLVNLNSIEKLFTPNNKTLYELPGLDLDPEKLVQKAKKDSKIQDLMEEVFPTKKTCHTFDPQQIKEIFVQIYPYLDPFFEEVKHEFINENVAIIKKQHPTNSNLEESNGLDE